MENKVLAKVNDKEIMESDLQLLIQQIGPQRAMQFQTEEGKKQLLDELINQELFLIEGRKLGVEKTEEFLKELEYVKENMIKQFIIRDILEKVSVEEEELKEFYNEHQDMFKTQESVRASHILVDSKEKAEELLKELKEKSFEEVAKENSSCPSSANGGDLGNFEKGKMVPEFEEAAFALKVGEISQPVQTQFGYHIIKLTDREDAGVMSYEESKPQIENTVLLKKQQDVYLAKVDEIKKEVKVEVL